MSPEALFRSLANLFSPDAEGDLQQSANTRDKEDGADEVALCEAVVLQTQALRQDQRDGDDASKCSQAMLRGREMGRGDASNTCSARMIGLIINVFVSAKKFQQMCPKL